MNFIKQESILESQFFNIYLCDLFYFLEGTDTTYYDDNTTHYSAAEAQEYVKEKFKDPSSSLFKWTATIIWEWIET